MTEVKKPDDDPRSAVSGPRQRRRRGRIALALVVVLMLATAAAGAFMVGRPIDAPVWLRDRIETRLAESLPGLRIGFGRISVQLERSGQARVILWDVTVLNPQGLQIASLSDMEAGFAPAPLLRGQLVLREAQLSGAFVTLTRGADGRLGLALGDAFEARGDAPDLPQMIALVDAAFSDPRLAQLSAIEADALTIRYEDRRARRGWTADGGRLRIARRDGQLTIAGDVALLGGSAQVATVALNGTSTIGDTALEFGLSLRDLAAADIATQSPALAWLEVLDAPISGALRSRLREDGSLGDLNATLQIGAGVLQPNAATRAIPFDAARTYFTYAPDRARLSFDEISISSPLGAVSATGTAHLQGLEAGWPEALLGQMQLSDIRLDDDTLLDRGMELVGADMQFRLALEPFQLSLGRLYVADPSVPARFSGELIARPDGWQVALDATLERTTPSQVLSFWPEDFRVPPRKWVAEHVQDGVLEDVTFALRAEPGAVPMTYIDFAFREGAVMYNKRLPPISGGEGRVTIYDNRLAVRLDAGRIAPPSGGEIDLAGTTITLPDLRTRPNPGVIDLRARGSVTAALSYLDNEAWRVLEKAGRDETVATGQAEVAGRIAMPLRKGLKLPDITLDLAGVLRGVASDTLVPNRPLRAERLAFSVTNERVQIDGPVTVSGVPAEGRWAQPLQGGQGRVTASLRISPETLDVFNIALPPGTLSGRGQGTLSLDLPRDAAPRFVLESDLAGLAVSVPQLGWRLGEAERGAFRVIGQLGQPVAIDSLSLSGAGLEARGTLALRAGGGFEALRLTQLKVGSWLDSTALLSGRGAGAAPGIALRGGTLDLRSAPFGQRGRGAGGGGGEGGAPISVALDRLQVTENIELRRFAGEFQTGRGLEGRFTAQLGGKTPIRGRVVPQNGRSAFRITGEDAGDILKAAGLLKTVQNGTFRLDLAPVVDRTGSYDGELRIEGARLRNAPAIAGLLDAISIVGLIDQLNGPGIFFQEVEARFRLTPTRVILTRSSAVGPSMGISMDGFYDLARGEMDMQGVLSPIYILNAVGRIISRKGEGLIGFNFNLRGPVAQPRVAVNPLSVFTPGMFRDIFRRPPPDVSQ